MAHGLNSVIKRGVASSSVNCGKGVGSRRIFAPHFKLQVLDSYRNDADCKGNQRATARKYGIHRRQIQKWLQVENTLRNSVSNNNNAKGEKTTMITDPISSSNSSTEDNNKKSTTACNDFEVTLNGNRQRDDHPFNSHSGVASARVPAVTAPHHITFPSGPVHHAVYPLDFTTHGRSGGHASPTVATGSPSPLASPDPAAPIDLSLKRPTSMAVSAPVCCTLASPLSPQLASSPEPHPDVWDLSVKTMKRKYPSSLSSVCSSTSSSPKPVKLFKPYLDDVKPEPTEVKTEIADEPIIKIEPCCSAAVVVSTCETYYYNNNNNDTTSGYTLHELQPNYYYHHPHSYPIVECDSSSGYCYEDISYNHGSLTPLKQRQSYSLDFKLSAIDCYYQDSICKGNQRAVASKYNVHRRQIQKWLKQAEELRLRNESMKQLHAVR